MTLLRSIAIALLAITTIAVQAQDKGSIVVGQAVARASVGKQPNGAAFVQLENRGKSDDVLLSASSPAAGKVEIHRMQVEGDVMKMRAVDQLALKAGQKVDMKPGDGHHLMLIGLKKPLVAGDKFPLTLQFRQAGKVMVTVEVAAMGMPSGADKHEHHHHHHD